MALTDLLKRGSATTPVSSRSTLIRRVEGPRGISTRAAVYVRYVMYLLVTAGCAGITQVFMAAAGVSNHGGSIQFGLTTVMFAFAAISTMLYTTHRNEIIESTRHYVFGLCTFPATGVAGVLWIVRDVAGGTAASDDTLLQTMSFGMLLVFACTLAIPPLLFIKQIAGLHTMQRSRLDDEEMVNMWTRQDHLQR